VAKFLHHFLPAAGFPWFGSSQRKLNLLKKSSPSALRGGCWIHLGYILDHLDVHRGPNMAKPSNKMLSPMWYSFLSEQGTKSSQRQQKEPKCLGSPNQPPSCSGLNKKNMHFELGGTDSLKLLPAGRCTPVMFLGV
jgi:hypothetical protein